MKLEDISKQLNTEIGFYPVRTRTVKVPEEKWYEFCKSNCWNSDLCGAFSPKTLSAYLKENSQFADLNLIHEFFGHGLFFEYHPLGRNLVLSERKNLKETSKILSKNIKDFSELFAIWIERYYSRKLGLENLFNQKYLEASNLTSENLIKLDDLLEKLGFFGAFASMGFPKYYDGNRVRDLVERIYGKETMSNCKLGILYGSRKPYSDIDLLVVSEDIKDFDNDWLDIFSRTKDEFEKQLRFFAVSLRDPLLCGELIFGDRDYFEKKKEQWTSQPITEEAIKYNTQRHLELKKIVDTYPEGHKKRIIAKSYSESYLKNAFALRSGKNILLKRGET